MQNNVVWVQTSNFFEFLVVLKEHWKKRLEPCGFSMSQTGHIIGVARLGLV